jgi:hypothetical protein
MDSIKIFAIYAGYILTILSLIIFIVKPLRNLLIDSFKKSIKESEQEKLIKEIHETLQDLMIKGELQNKAQLSALRDNITETYYKYMDTKKIREYKRKSLIEQYDSYHRMNGNSYVDVIYEEMLEWEVIK